MLRVTYPPWNVSCKKIWNGLTCDVTVRDFIIKWNHKLCFVSSCTSFSFNEKILSVFYDRKMRIHSLRFFVFLLSREIEKRRSDDFILSKQFWGFFLTTVDWVSPFWDSYRYPELDQIYLATPTAIYGIGLRDRFVCANRDVILYEKQNHVFTAGADVVWAPTARSWNYALGAWRLGDVYTA